MHVRGRRERGRKRGPGRHGSMPVIMGVSRVCDLQVTTRNQIGEGFVPVMYTRLYSVVGDRQSNSKLKRRPDWTTSKEDLNVLSSWESLAWRRQILGLVYFHHVFSQYPSIPCCLTSSYPLPLDRWNRALDNGDQCGVVFADMSKAFDRVQHTGLLGELATTGLGGTVLKWFSDYLTNRSQQVTVNGEKGDTKPCTRGVPQGSVLGPLLFCVYIRRVPDIFHQSVVQLYADDVLRIRL